jgi:hypothetical protein
MKVFLMYRDRDVELQVELPWNAKELTQDLELETLFNAMARGDAFLFDVARKTLFGGLDGDPDNIGYRQHIRVRQ